MSLSLQLTAEDDALLTLAADRLHISKSEFVRRSIAAYAARVIPAEKTEAEIDAMYIGQGGGAARSRLGEGSAQAGCAGEAA